MRKYKFGLWLIFMLVLGLCAYLWASDKSTGSCKDMRLRSPESKFEHKLLQAEEISLHTPHPNPLPQGERELHKFLPLLMGGGQGEGEDVNLFNSFVINWMKKSLLFPKGTEAPLSPDPWLSHKVQESGKIVAETGAIHGRVTTAQGGSPISNVVITASQLTCPYHSFSDTTGSDGFYLIGDLPCGEYAVRTTNDSLFVDLFWNNKLVWETPDTVLVSSNDTTENMNFSLRVGGKITGTISLPGALIVLYTFVLAIDTSSGTAYYDMPIGLLGTASYTIKRLPTGIYKLRTFNLLGYIDVYYSNKSSWATADPVSVTEGSTTSSKNFTLSSGGKIEGNVSGPLGDSALVLGVQLSDSLEWFQIAFTNASGNYSLSGLRSGYWKVFALGDTTYAFEFYNNKDTWSSADSISVTAPNTVSNINFSLEVGGSLSGHVYDLGGNPFSNCFVAAYESSLVGLLAQVGIPFLGQAGIALRGGTTSGDGSYKITGLRTGDYYVKASTECDSQWYDQKPSWDQADLVHVTMPNQTSGIDFNLPSAFIRGDASGDGVVDVTDVVYLINYLFVSGPPPVPLEAGDVNCNCVVDVADVVYLINYLFVNGPPPSC
jgi:hypothetical protein